MSPRDRSGAYSFRILVLTNLLTASIIFFLITNFFLVHENAILSKFRGDETVPLTKPSSDDDNDNNNDNGNGDEHLDNDPSSNHTPEYLNNGVAVYLEAARSVQPITDKVTSHTYQIMYGKFLLPYYHQKPSMKMLEIGLGCDMTYGPGASVNLYKKLFPEAELWEAEYNRLCVERNTKAGKLDGIHVVVGDQGNVTVLDSWIEKSGGNFDVVIDDGGHHNCQIWQSFQKLWPTVNPGGLYFIEDMQVAKNAAYRKATTETCDGNLIVPEKLKEIVDDLLYDRSRKSDIEFIFCQSEACVLGKKHLSSGVGN